MEVDHISLQLIFFYSEMVKHRYWSVGLSLQHFIFQLRNLSHVGNKYCAWITNTVLATKSIISA